MLCSGNGAQRLLELHRDTVLYLGSLVPNSVLTEKEARHMLAHTLVCFLSLTRAHTLEYMHGMCTNMYRRTLGPYRVVEAFSGCRLEKKYTVL